MNPARVEARCNECGEPASTCDCGMDSEGRFDAPASTGVREDEARVDLAERLEQLAQHNTDAAYGGSIGTQDERLAAARAYRHAAALSRAALKGEDDAEKR